eukprot:9339151-Lingulodinium_polyedra.AAC.1
MGCAGKPAANEVEEGGTTGNAAAASAVTNPARPGSAGWPNAAPSCAASGAAEGRTPRRNDA